MAPQMYDYCRRKRGTNCSRQSSAQSGDGNWKDEQMQQDWTARRWSNENNLPKGNWEAQKILPLQSQN